MPYVDMYNNEILIIIKLMPALFEGKNEPWGWGEFSRNAEKRKSEEQEEDEPPLDPAVGQKQEKEE